jgi:hypothetical protein
MYIFVKLGKTLVLYVSDSINFNKLMHLVSIKFTEEHNLNRSLPVDRMYLEKGSSRYTIRDGDRKVTDICCNEDSFSIGFYNQSVMIRDFL